MESDHKKSFYYRGKYFVKLSDYYEDEQEETVRVAAIAAAALFLSDWRYAWCYKYIKAEK